MLSLLRFADTLVKPTLTSYVTSGDSWFVSHLNVIRVMVSRDPNIKALAGGGFSIRGHCSSIAIKSRKIFKEGNEYK